MSLQDLSNAAQVFSALAIVVSLIFVFFQLRQNDKTQRALMHQSALQRTMDTNMFLFAGENVPLLDAVARGDMNLTAPEVLRLNGMIRVTVLNLEDILWQQKAGFLDADTAEGVIISMRRWYAMPGTRVAWALFRAGYSEAQAKLVEDLIIAPAPLSSTDFALAWKATAEQVLRRT